MAQDSSQPAATLGDVHVVGRARPIGGAQLRYAVTVRRPCPISGSLDQITVSNGMALFTGDVLTSRAFVSGVDIVFGDRVEALVGQGLVAHEVTHVIQQGRNTTSPMNNGAVGGKTSPESEGEEGESSEPSGAFGPGRGGSIGPAPFDAESAETETTE